MKERQKRLKEAYEHVRKFFGIHTQEDFAKSLHKSRNAITLALNGNEKYLTDNLFSNICEAFPGVFNLDYLLTGEGELLAKQEKGANEKTEIQLSQNVIDQSSLVNAALAAKDESIASLKRELQTKEELIQSLRDQLSTKDQLIAEQKARLVDYRRLIDTKDLFKNYPFQMGVAEDQRQQKHP